MADSNYFEMDDRTTVSYRTVLDADEFEVVEEHFRKIYKDNPELVEDAIRGLYGQGPLESTIVFTTLLIGVRVKVREGEPPDDGGE